MIERSADFIARWKGSQLTERQGAQSHFIELCQLVDHSTPTAIDPQGRDFTFERLVKLPDKRGKKAHGWADVYKKGYFAWEYKRPGQSLDKAYEQLKLYKDELENPPLLVVSDFTHFRIHTNFNNAPREVYPFGIESLKDPVIFKQLHDVFHNPENLRPQTTVEKITKQTAAKLAAIAQLAIARNEKLAEQKGLPTQGIAQSVARYLDRIVFCLFAEDIGLFGDGVFSEIVKRYSHSPKNFADQTAQLFNLMSSGGFFGVSTIPHFNGALFKDEPIIELSARELEAVKEAAKLDWKDVDPSIFGTLFEHGLKEERSVLGAHYTGREDIESLVEPVILTPLRREWNTIRAVLERIDEEIEREVKDKAKGRGEQKQRLEKWFSRLEDVRVLDPACGSGNFLSVTLSALLDLEKQASIWAADAGIRTLEGQHFETRVRPAAMLGIEVNGYAQDLARTVVQITYLQWLHDNGYPHPGEPILRHTDNIWHCDALLDASTGNETVWPEAEFLVGNPPFLGDKKLRRQLEDPYVEALFRCFRGRVASSSDLCCYWFYKARKHVVEGKTRRAGLVATQSITGGKNREVLDALPNIFFAISDREWALDGANLRISLVGFDNGEEQEKQLDGHEVGRILSNLTATTNIIEARKLSETVGIAFMGDTKGGAFDISFSEAEAMLQMPNPHRSPNSDVLLPWINGLDIVRRPRDMWIIDFGSSMNEAEIAAYERPFFKIESSVKPERQKNKRDTYRKLWWRHVEPRPALLKAISELERFLVTVAVSKHHVFTWSENPVLPDHQLFIFARSDDYFFGVMHSRAHEVWALRLGTRLDDRPRYTPTSCFDTFPLPKADECQKAAISKAAAHLNEWRGNWLNPQEWMREEMLEFRASQEGPWHRHIIPGTVKGGVGIARFARKVLENPRKTAIDHRYDPKTKMWRDFTTTTTDALAHRTLTNLYNHPPEWLINAHRTLDHAVFAAYGFPVNISDEEILARLLALNLERAGRS